MVEVQGDDKVLNEEELEFLADPGIAEAKAVLMANLSSYGSDVLSENEITSDSNIIPYSQYLLETQHAVVQDTNSSAQQDAMILSVVITKETNVISIADSEETLMLKEESRSKIRLKQSDPMVLEKKAPREFLKVSLVNTSLKKLKYHLGQFDNVVKKRITPDALTEGEWGFEYTKAEKVVVITALKNDLRKLKGKKIADNNLAQVVSNAITTIALPKKMYKGLIQ
ncbi:hypothetical protein Tco_0459918 [Tanacetum coccineum]